MSPPLSQLHVDSMAWVPQEPPTAESIQLFITEKAVSLSYDLVPLHSPVSKLTIFSQSSCVSLAELWQGKGVGTRRRDVLVFYKSFNIFWPRVYSKYVRRNVQLCTYCTLNKYIKFVTRFSTNMDIGQDIPEHHTVCTNCVPNEHVAALFINFLL
jgi:hypothetical protein